MDTASTYTVSQSLYLTFLRTPGTALFRFPFNVAGFTEFRLSQSFWSLANDTGDLFNL